MCIYVSGATGFPEKEAQVSGSSGAEAGGPGGGCSCRIRAVSVYLPPGLTWEAGIPSTTLLNVGFGVSEGKRFTPTFPFRVAENLGLSCASGLMLDPTNMLP